MANYYKIKHVPTGLYYKPALGILYKTNLSKKGKVYSINLLARMSDPVYLHITEKQYNDLKEVFDKYGVNEDTYGYFLKCPKSDFELETLNLS